MRRESAMDHEIAALAADQRGVVSRAQLSMLGLSAQAIDRRVRAQRFHMVHRGVYAVGHRVLTIEGWWMAAVLAGGRGAVLSHGTAAAVWELRPVGSGVIHITVPGDRGRKRRQGINVHRSTTLTPREVTARKRLPVTTPARTIIDLSRTLRGRALEHVVDLADQRGLVDFTDLRAANSASLKAVLSNYRPASTRSELEEGFLNLCDEHGIERPETNVLIEGILVDFVWRDRKLIVEVDGYRYHRAPSRFERDRENDVTLTVKGWRVMRFTWRKVEERPRWVAAAIRTGAPPVAA
jgi:very-short-patch-repair endonuclease